jgi:hypothetical protein
VTAVFFTFESIREIESSFEERCGPPDECTSALGHVIVGFSWLEESLDKHIAELSQISSRAAPALTAELPFKTKVSILSSLVQLDPPLCVFNSGSVHSMDEWRDIIKMIATAEELRNKLVHSKWSSGGQEIRRTKITAKATRGVRVVSEVLSSDYLFDVYDYILNVQWVLDELFLRYECNE